MRSAISKQSSLTNLNVICQVHLSVILFARNLKWPLLGNLGSLKLDHWQYIGARYSNLPQDHVTVKHVFILETVLRIA